jgi:hypothetical protein
MVPAQKRANHSEEARRMLTNSHPCYFGRRI